MISSKKLHDLFLFNIQNRLIIGWGNVETWDSYLVDHYKNLTWKSEVAIDESRQSLVELYEDDIPRKKVQKIINWPITPSPLSMFQYKGIIDKLFDRNWTVSESCQRGWMNIKSIFR